MQLFICLRAAQDKAISLCNGAVYAADRACDTSQQHGAACLTRSAWHSGGRASAGGAGSLLAAAGVLGRRQPRAASPAGGRVQRAQAGPGPGGGAARTLPEASAASAQEAVTQQVSGTSLTSRVVLLAAATPVSTMSRLIFLHLAALEMRQFQSLCSS